ncbi:hypothetical protein Tco_0938350 [Tanacetum coccineum]|uniref:Uncharacterized protein n=1 Tax=Tanacetum coccineum TaxID=301880 RepID=A0ABQ5DHJ7_9ASTR
MPELTRHGGTMAASLRHQWRDTICGGGAYGCILGGKSTNVVTASTKLPKESNEFGDWVKLSNPKQALRGRHPMLIRRLSGILKLSCSRFCPSFTRASYPQLHFGKSDIPNLID